MYNRLFLSIIMALTMALQSFPRSISHGVALERALSAGPTPAEMLRNSARSVRPEYTLAYSAPSGSYYVFNRSTGGYIVVSGDDGIAPVLADVTSGEFSINDMAPAAGWMLGEYDASIRTLSESYLDDEWLSDYYTEWTAIAPLMTTQWNQQNPFNIYCPVIGGVSCMTGCVATAMAQVVRCIGYYEGSGYRSYNGVNSYGRPVEFDYASADFDFDIMFNDAYDLSGAPAESIDQVGRLMLACGLGVSMNYGVSESGAQSQNVERALVEHFGYDKDHTRFYNHDGFTQAQWENMLYAQLRLGRPVYYSGASGSAAHAFVVDGYLPAGLYHVNWGWGGMSDGYFRLSALNPYQTGIGGGSGGYNSGQQMVCAVPPGEEPGVIYGKMGGSIGVVSDGVYALYYKSKSQSLLNMSLGAVIVDDSGNTVAATTFWNGMNISASGAVRHDSFRYDFTQISLPSGSYRIYPAYHNDGDDEYFIAEQLFGQPHFLRLTVTDSGEYVIKGASAVSAESDVHIADIVAGYDLRFGHSGNFSFYAINNGDIDYKGFINVGFIDASGNEIASAKTQSLIIPARTNFQTDCSFPVFDTAGSLIEAGVYALRFTDNQGNPLSDGEFGVEIKSGIPYSEWQRYENIEVTNAGVMPTTIVSGDLWAHTPTVTTMSNQRSLSLGIAFYAPSGNSVVKKLPCFEGSIDPMTGPLTIDPVTVDVPFGNYEVCYQKNYTQISQRVPVRVGVAVGGLCCLPPASGQGGVSVTVTPGAGAQEEIVVPAEMTVGGTVCPVTEIESDAFLWQRSLSAIELPSSIRKIGVNAFMGCPSLEQIIMRSEMPPFAYRNYVAPGLGSSVGFYVPASSYEAYASVLADYNPVYAIVDAIESKDVMLVEPLTSVTLSVTPAHEAVDPAFVVTAADDAAAEVAAVKIVSAEPGRLNLEVEALHSGDATFHIRPAHRSDDYAVLNVTVSETTIMTEAVENTDRRPQTVYDLLGRPLPAGFRSGFRIVVDENGKVAKIVR